MRRLIVVLLLVAGCSANTRPSPPYEVSATGEPTAQPTEKATQEPTSEPQVHVDPTVVAQGFTANPESDSASYAVVIENPNPASIPRFVSISITFVDTEGTVLATAAQSIPGLGPESETAVAGDAPEAGSATEMEVQISSPNGLPSPMRSSLNETGHYEFERVQTARGELGEIKTTGAVFSRFGAEQDNVAIHVVYYSAGGEVVGGAVTYVEETAAAAH